MARTKQYYILIFLLAGLTWSENALGQSGFLDFLTRPTTIKLQSHAIDDDRNSFSGLMKLNNWSTSFVPSKIVVAKTIQDRIKVDLGVGFLKMNPMIYKERYLSPGNFISADLNFRYQINLASNFFDNLHEPRGSAFLNAISLMGFNIYPLIGLGYTHRTQTVFRNSINLNVGGGVTMWFIRNRLGVNLESQAKVGLDALMPISGSNYIHHSAGLVIVSKSSNYIGRNRRNIQRSRVRIKF